MVRIADSRGVHWTAASENTAQLLFDTIERFLTYRADTMACVDKVLAQDPECPGVWVLKGALFILNRQQSMIPRAKDALAKAAAHSGGATARERQLIHALSCWAAGDLRAAQTALDGLLVDAPHDLLALRLQHVNAIFFGSPEVLRTTMARALTDWHDDIPGAGVVYGMACMALEEAGAYTRAEKLGRRGAELAPDDLWCVHSVAHVMEARGDLSDGIAWMQKPESYWQDRGPMRHHLWWHEALFFYEAGDMERVLDYYDLRLAPTGQVGYLEMSNCASLLYRVAAAGGDCASRWQDLVQNCAHLAEDRALTFADVHLLIALAMAGEDTALGRLARDLSDYAAGGTSFDRIASARIGVPLARAMQARRAGRHGAAAQILGDVRYDFPAMGGSIAQRDMLEILLVDTTIAAGQTRAARRLVNAYLDQRPHSAPMQRISEALGVTGAPAGS